MKLEITISEQQFAGLQKAYELFAATAPLGSPVTSAQAYAEHVMQQACDSYARELTSETEELRREVETLRKKVTEMQARERK